MPLTDDVAAHLPGRPVAVPHSRPHRRALLLPGGRGAGRRRRTDHRASPGPAPPDLSCFPRCSTDDAACLRSLDDARRLPAGVLLPGHGEMWIRSGHRRRYDRPGQRLVDNIRGKTVAITGAARGIGFATARALLARGAGGDRGPRRRARGVAVARLGTLGPVSGYPLDVADPGSFAAFPGQRPARTAADVSTSSSTTPG